MLRLAYNVITYNVIGDKAKVDIEGKDQCHRRIQNPVKQLRWCV